MQAVAATKGGHCSGPPPAEESNQQHKHQSAKSPAKATPSKRRGVAIATEPISQNKRHKAEANAEKKPKPSPESAVSGMKVAQEDSKSVTSEAAQEPAQKMKSAREYQLHCFDMAKQRNTFVYLGTGLGKTLVAELLIQWYLRKQDADDRFIIFLAPGTYLLEQQAAIIERETEARVKVLHGELNNYFSLWNAKDFEEKVSRSEFDVVAIAPDLFVRALQCGFFSMQKDIKLLIFDEAHHCHGRDKYRLVMDLFYFRIEEKLRPKVLCLSASPIKDAELKKENIEERFRKVQRQFDCHIVHPPHRMLQKYMNKVESVVESFADPEKVSLEHVTAAQGVEKGQIFHEMGDCYSPALQLVLKVRFETLTAGVQEHVKKVLESSYWQTLQCQLRDLIWQLGVQAAVVFLKREMLGLTRTDFFLCKCPFCLEIRRQDAAASVAEPKNCLMAQTLVAMGKRLLKYLRAAVKSDQSPMQFVSTKMASLCGVLTRELDKVGKDLKGVIFCKRRLVALELSNLLQSKGLRAEYVVGMKGRDSATMTRKLFNQAMGRFHDSSNNDYINFLVATSVVEEGVDVPACRLIVMFDEVETVKQQIQCNGRARHAEACVVHLVMAAQRKRVLQKLESMREVRVAMDKFVEDFALHVETNSNPRIEKPRVVKDLDKDSLHVEKTGAFITTHTSKAFLHNIFYHFDPTSVEKNRVPLSEPQLSMRGLTKKEESVHEDVLESTSSAASVDPKKTSSSSYVCRLELPPLNDIMNYTGKCMDAICVEGKGKGTREAEYRACLKALIVLHERKILDDNLTVVGRGCPSHNNLHHAPMNRGRAMPVYRITRSLPPYFHQGHGLERKVYPNSQKQSPRLWIYGFVPHIDPVSSSLDPRCGKTDTNKVVESLGPVGLLLPHRISEDELSSLCTDFYPPCIVPGVPSWPRAPSSTQSDTDGNESSASPGEQRSGSVGREGGSDPFHHPVRLRLLNEDPITLSPDEYVQVLLYQKHLFRVSRLIRGQLWWYGMRSYELTGDMILFGCGTLYVVPCYLPLLRVYMYMFAHSGQRVTGSDVMQLDDDLDRYQLVPETLTRPHTQRNWIVAPLNLLRVRDPQTSSSPIAPDFDGDNDAEDASGESSVSRKRKLESKLTPEAKRCKTGSGQTSVLELICWESVKRVCTAVADANARKRLNNDSRFSINTDLIEFVKQNGAFDEGATWSIYCELAMARVLQRIINVNATVITRRYTRRSRAV